jgi:hypothetical protein
MNPLFVAAAAVQDLCRERGWGYCFIGGLAVLRWGEPRLTRDIDLTILAGFGAEEPVVDGLLARFEARIDDARNFALRNRVALLRASNGVPVDVALGALDFEQRAAERASLWDVKEAQLLTCSAEDLIVHKAFAGRDRDWLDIEGIVIRQGEDLDSALMLRELAPLLGLKGDYDAVERLRTLLELRTKDSP